MTCSECGRRYRSAAKPARDVAQMVADPADSLCPRCQDAQVLALRRRMFRQFPMMTPGMDLRVLEDDDD